MVTRLRAVPRWVWVAVVAIVVVVAAVVTVLIVTSGPDDPGDVTFTAGGVSVAADPTVYCDLMVTDCETAPDDVVTLPLPAGVTVDLTVPDAVRSTPWQVAFAYLDENGAPQSGRSQVFAPNAAGTFRLALPDPRWRLERVEVQQFGASEVQTPQGSLFSTRSTWVLTG
ncbi:DUF2771 family protein [Actinomycetospora termitidis]|uniref:DUF2771 family protein n=1 Tax=Actinomycetospora termitidis TaxID=3053470 RepID=A0ABT7M9Y7_9PSEU|nr:DUF2771 family protein [Actinomycetospora sp. Odt1-22]MDL5157474.1 DUF2771 family protein [Actinomycetospora sp. Odt1-22]